MIPRVSFLLWRLQVRICNDGNKEEEVECPQFWLDGEVITDNMHPEQRGRLRWRHSAIVQVVNRLVRHLCPQCFSGGRKAQKAEPLNGRVGTVWGGCLAIWPGFLAPSVSDHELKSMLTCKSHCWQIDLCCLHNGFTSLHSAVRRQLRNQAFFFIILIWVHII